MKKLFTNLEFINAKSNEQLPCLCQYCNKTFYLTKHEIQIKLISKYKNMFCSYKCKSKFQIAEIKIKCTNCNKEFNRIPSQIKKSKSNNHFCSQSCAATYSNLHKNKGNCRSKLEKYLEEQLKLLYPDLKILFNDKTTINSELDIYIPSLKLAFELNGIFHYEPIFGQDKLNQILNNDNRKFQASIEHGIELCIIDVSQQKYFKEQSTKKYLNIINNVINNNLGLYSQSDSNRHPVKVSF